MRQVWISRYGGPEVLEVREAPDPSASAGQIRVRVKAAGVNFADVSARAGLYPDAPKAPMVVGYEVSGVVDQVGTGATRFAEGDEVLTVTRFGGYSDVVVVEEHQAVKVPAGKDLEAAAGIPVTYLTAYVMLNRLGSVRPGDTVLIHAAAGGVGLSALQLATHLGAVTIGTASKGKHERLKEMGLGHAIDYRNEDVASEVRRLTDGRGCDVILDAVGGQSFRTSYKLLAPMGRLFMFGMSAGNAESRAKAWRTLPKALATTPLFHPMSLLNNNRGVFGINMGHLWDEGDLIARTLGELADLWADGVIDPVIHATFPFERAGDAHQELEQARNFGKVLLVP